AAFLDPGKTQDVLPVLVPAEEELPVGRVQVEIDALHEGALARAALPHDPQDLPFMELEGNVAQRDHGAAPRTDVRSLFRAGAEPALLAPGAPFPAEVPRADQHPLIHV